MSMKSHQNGPLRRAFKSAYQLLNSAQEKAVESTDGPVLVLAGPGTGKTQILALRIGNILINTDTKPGNILCLTYTDAGAIAMRKRLLKFIGPEAYKVQVHTFHSFCNQVIQDNQEIFSDQATLHHISDLEKAQMFKDLIDQFPYQHPLRRLKGQLYFEGKRLDQLFSLMKRESWSVDYLLTEIERERLIIEADPANFYKRNGRNYRVGDPNQKYLKKTSNLATLKAAVEAFKPFQDLMHDAGRYDFDDMIHWVMQAFEKDESLLASYQERFLYVLVDEYQDTNGSQNKIIDLLVDYWERPNLFVVGDDDQAIFRFQGANISNLQKLYLKYDPEVIVLTENYRSTQPILDAAMALIEHNTERVTDEIPGISKSLTAQPQPGLAPTPQIVEYLNVAQEETGVFEALKNLHRKGQDLTEVAVIYRKHAQATNLIKALSQIGVPVDVRQRSNILDEPIVQNIENILSFLHYESIAPGTRDSLLFEILHYRFFDLPPADVAKISMYCWKDHRNPISLRHSTKDFDVLESLEVSNIDAFIRFNAILDDWLSQLPHVTLQVLLEKILKRGNIFREIMSSEHRTHLMQVIATFFNYVKDESHRQPRLKLSEFLSTLKDMREIGLRLEMQNIMRSKNGVRFMTAHGAKGLEFDHVFIIGANKGNWNSRYNRRNGYSLPSTIVDPSVETDQQDERRLFYVAMTRARKFLQLSYSAENINGMPAEPSQFIAEIISRLKVIPREEIMPERSAVDFYVKLLGSKDQKLPLLDHDLIDRVLERFQLSPTALNKYLACPRSFYFENILRVPLANSPYLGFGNAVHYALQKMIEDYGKGGVMHVDRLNELFRNSMAYFQSHFSAKEYENYLKHGEFILPQYLEKSLPEWLASPILIAEKNISHVTHRGVPIKGRIDLILKTQDGRVKVIDFKTGNMNNVQRRQQKLRRQASYDELGGDYWRQVVFYKILMDENNDPDLRMEVGEMSFVEPDRNQRFYSQEFLVDIGEYGIVSNQITEVFEKMRSHEFDVDCSRPDCNWCNFVGNEFVLPDDTFDELAESEEGNFPEEMGQMQFDF